MPQFGIFAQGSLSHEFLEFDLLPGATRGQAPGSVRELMAPETTMGKINLVLAFGPRAWREMAPGEAPSGLEDFEEVVGPGLRRAPATQHDAWVWISGGTQDTVWECTLKTKAAMGGFASVATERAGFTYRENRDILGFQDGTANPPLQQAPSVALVPSGEPGAGGSHVLAMRWVHDVQAFNRLSVRQQEEVFGRTKEDSIELPEGVRPETAHISRVTVKENGEELKIYRRSVPYGDAKEQGLCFVAFSADPTRYRKMLARMFGTTGDGVHDRLMEFTRAVSGAMYFAPSLDALSSL